MSLLRLFARRVALGFIAAWAVLTTVFLVFTTSRDWVAAGIEASHRFGGADDAAVERAVDEYLSARGLDRPLWEQYFDWMWSMLTLDWGESFHLGEPVVPMVVGSVLRTAMYVVPAVVVATAAGLLLGCYAAMHPDGRMASYGLGGAYCLFALPNFWVGGILLSFAAGDVIDHSTLLFEHVLPIALTATTLLGGYVSFSRAHSLEYVSADFVTLVKAKGASGPRIAMHVVRNASIPLFSMLFSEALALLVLSVFVVETLFGIEGFGVLLFEAIQVRDLPVVLGASLVIIGVGIVGNVLQDISYALLDPRVDTGKR